MRSEKRFFINLGENKSTEKESSTLILKEKRSLN